MYKNDALINLWNNNILKPNSYEQIILDSWKFFIEHLTEEAKQIWWEKYPENYCPDWKNLPIKEKAYLFDCFYQVLNKLWVDKNYGYDEEKHQIY